VKQAALYDLITMGRSSIDLYSNDIGVPFVEIRSFAAYVGGSSTNIAVGARQLGLKTVLLTVVGPDLVGDFIHSMPYLGEAYQLFEQHGGF
jgi:5-dehydro-2-deoxygluconokinase